MTEQYQCQSYSDDDRNVQDCTWGKCGNTPDTEWEEEFEHLSCSNLLREKDPIYGEENRRAKQQLKTFITTLLTSRDTYLKERVNHILDSHIEMARDSLKNAVADQAAPYKHQLGRLLQTKSEILNILSDNLN